jgi:hypothetical protein
MLVAVTAGAPRLSLFENGALRKICETKTIDITGDWRKLHVEELHEFYPSPSIIQVIKINGMGLACGIYEGKDSSIQCFGGKTEKWG